MDSGALERLRRLQMEDLGTARREYISTHERRRAADVGLDELDATRVAKQAGSEAHRAAELNKARLASWANVHKDLGDTQDLENLDNLLDGQSHRAQLTALIRKSGGQSYTKVLNKKDNFLKVAESNHRGGPPPGRHSSGGRGGGVIGTRGRKTTFSSPESGSSRTSHQGVIKKLGRHAVEAPLGRTRLDPALDVNNDPSNKSKLDKPKYQGNDGYRQLLRTNIRTRRPITGDYARILSPPESFLAIARSVVQDKPSNNASAATPQSPNIPPNPKLRTEQPGNEPKNPAKGSSVPYQDYAQKRESVASSRQEDMSKPIPTLETSLHGMKAPNPAVAARSPAQNDKFKDSEYASLHFKLRATTDKNGISASSLASGGASRERQPVPSFKEPSTPKAQIKPASVETKEELLLDFGTTPSDPSPLREKDIQSPAFEDLKGIHFEHSTNASSSENSLHERSNSEQQTESKKGGFNKEAVVSSKKASRSDYEREIFLLGVFLESTTLGEEYCDQFKKIKAELEEHLRNDHSQETTMQAAQKSFANDNISATNTEQNTPADKPKMTPAVPSTAENTPTKQVEKPSISKTEDNTGSQLLRKAINAPLFYPRSRNFSGYRSPINSTSSDSTPPPTPSPSRSKAIPSNRPSHVLDKPEPPTEHIFGDHLLPGRRSRDASALRSTDEPISRRASASSHSSSLKPTNTLAPRSPHNASQAAREASKDTTMSIKALQQGSHTASNTEKMHAGALSVQAKTPDATPMEQKVEPISRESHTSRPGTNPVSSKSPSIMASKEMQGTMPKFTSIQQSIHAMSPSSKSSASDNTPMPRTVASTTHANPATPIKTSNPTKSPSTGMVKELPGPRPKLASIEQSIHAVSGWTSSKNQPSMSMPRSSQRPSPNASPSERSSIYSPFPNPQKKDGPTRLSGVMSSRYATLENDKPAR